MVLITRNPKAKNLSSACHLITTVLVLMGGHKLQYNIASVLEEAVTEIRSYPLDTNSKGDPRGFSLFL